MKESNKRRDIARAKKRYIAIREKELERKKENEKDREHKREMRREKIPISENNRQEREKIVI